MEKILLAIDAANIDLPAIEFACYIATLSRSKLTGVFIGNSQAETPAFYSDENVRLFEKICLNHGVRPDLIHISSKLAVREIIAESRFADLIILKADMCIDQELQAAPSPFVAELLTDAECPVLVAPPSFNGIDEIIFAYDGTRSSVFAIKQFTYLFPHLLDKRAMLLEVTEQANGELTAKGNIKELLKAHYSGTGYHLLHGKATDELFAYLLHKKTSMVVMGAYGKNLFPKLLKQSTAAQLLKTVDCPFFITHC